MDNNPLTPGKRLVYLALSFACLLLITLIVFFGVTGETPIPTKAVGVRILGAESITVGETAQLSAELIPSNAVGTEIYWYSGAPFLVSVDDKGLVTGLVPGEATVEVKTASGIIAKRKILVEASKNDPIPTIPPTTKSDKVSVNLWDGVF